VDISQEMLEQAAFRLPETSGRLKLFCQDMRRLKTPRPADAAVCLCDGFNYLLSEEDVYSALRSIYGALKPGGFFMLDVSSYAKLSAMDGSVFCEDLDDLAYIWFNSFDEDTRRLNMELTFFVGREDGLFERREEAHVQCAHSAEFLTRALVSCGFEEVRACSAFTFDPACDGDERIAITARRAK